MRKLKLQVQLSVDGFVAGPNGEMDWVTFNWDDELNNYVTELTNPVDCIVLGRKLAEGFIPHWAARPESEDSDSIDKMNNTKKVVFTKTLTHCEWANTTLANGDLTEEIATLKNEPGGDIIAYGGASFVSSLIKHNLIDEFNLFINPIAIGKGMAIFNRVESNRTLTLEQSRAFPCGIVLVRYLKTA